MFLYRIRISRIGLSQSVVILIDAKGSFEKKKKKIESMTFEIYTIIMCKKKKKKKKNFVFFCFDSNVTTSLD